MWLEGRLLEGGHAVRVELDGPRIGRIEALDAASGGVSGGLPERWLAPGLLDLQVNGYGGHDANAPDVSPETIARLVRALWRRGVTALCPTVVTQAEGRICRSLAAIVAARAADPLVARAIPRIHVEGPHISPQDGPRGAHPPEHVRPPDLAEYRRWQEAAQGRIGIVTVAPEHAGAPEYIGGLAADGVVVAVGHTAASGERLRAAVDAGARLSTHLGNGAHAQLPRHPNYLWEQLAEDRLCASLIFDGHHLPPAVMTTMLRAKGVERSILVSDAVAVAGLAPGRYETAVGGRVELLPTGRLNLAGTPYLAGSASTLPEGIANAVRLAGASLADAVRMGSGNPARLLGLDGPGGRGSVRSGAAADLTVFRVDRATGDLVVELTVVGGEVVHQADEAPRAAAGVRG